MLKKLVLFVAAVMLLASSAQAAPNEVQSGSEQGYLQPGVCGPAGYLTLTFEKGAVLDNSTDLLLTLPKGKLCQPIDFFLNATTAQVVDNVGPLTGAVGNTVTGGDFIMHVENVSDQAVRLKVLGPGKLNVGNETVGLSINLFNGLNASDELLVGNWNGSRLVDVSNDTAIHNTWCIEAEGAEGDLIYVALTSDPKKFSYKGGQPPAVAILKPSSTVSVVKAKKDVFKKVEEGDQKVCSVDYETGDFCGVTGGRYFALKNGGDYPTGRYTVEMEVLVNGASGDNGVYFEADPKGVQFVDAIASLRSAFNSSAPGVLGPNKTERYLGKGSKTTKTPVGGCDRKDDEKITKITYEFGDVDAGLKVKDYLRVNIPSLAVTKAVAGDAVELNITVKQGRCGVLYSGKYLLFTMVDKCSDDEKAAGSKLVFPYFADAPYWNGMALTNTGTAPVNATLAIVDAKGGKASIDVVVPAEGMYVDLLENIIMGQSAANGTVNYKERCYIIVTPQSGNLKGFAMMGNAGESMGYTVNND